MKLAAGITAALGALVTLIGSILMVRIRPDNPRYQDDGLLYPGQQESKVVPALLHDQQSATALIAAGGAIQLVATVLALVA
ncbi:Uncharacterised protein [Mycobacteroides abscessus subsp. abscessus]|uniref:hypothetical protein n=1 Tax=Mycobacteroides abscessus TaxID=36809 RepID=UPI000927B76A|nr:hypothetical protein [Mycobacteroides abscessus]SHP28707.1 Uncharacterised protein [Mycobacteroides abscessus subsp. abscessus]SHP68820.1 Uncharacterised protein [Mycobacteroides abscessus subsp. abscessus]SHY39305.1 Uncharacterised protein [Mycobacteroides abscessus subsp. abscessus]SKD93583.1 Uncharacterised protein [Mycobacteroides abscessus subsp. abscessus]